MKPPARDQLEEHVGFVDYVLVGVALCTRTKLYIPVPYRYVRIVIQRNATKRHELPDFLVVVLRAGLFLECDYDGFQEIAHCRMLQVRTD
jgi:hypothetical protein